MTSYKIVYSVLVYPGHELSDADKENLESELEDAFDSVLLDYYDLDGFNSEVIVEARQ